MLEHNGAFKCLICDAVIAKKKKISFLGVRNRIIKKFIIMNVTA